MASSFESQETARNFAAMSLMLTRVEGLPRLPGRTTYYTHMMYITSFGQSSPTVHLDQPPPWATIEALSANATQALLMLNMWRTKDDILLVHRVNYHRLFNDRLIHVHVHLSTFSAQAGETCTWSMCLCLSSSLTPGISTLSLFSVWVGHLNTEGLACHYAIIMNSHWQCISTVFVVRRQNAFEHHIDF